jgi:hypothetical protein
VITSGTLAILGVISALAGLIAGGFKLWSAFFRDKKATAEFQSGVDSTTSKVNKEAADAERRASDASTNAKRGSDLDDDLKSGRTQF